MRAIRYDVSNSDETLIIGEYDLTSFDPSLFGRCNVAMDAALKGSVNKRQAEYLAGRLLAMQAMAIMGIPSFAPPRAASGAPVWPKGLRGSISHSNGTAAVWITHAAIHPGLDIETQVSPRQAKAIESIVLTDAERAMGLDDSALTVAFSGKEAIYKALYPQVGYRFGFECAELVQPPTRHSANFRLTKILCPDFVKGAALNVLINWRDAQVMTRCNGVIVDGPLGRNIT